ncbi:DUF5776 domain-containing protein [Pediococcus ethanolidurans]|uniref:Glycosyl hydrolases family 25 n=1 Tax=Pediococcus ethanolidurans TaxID=319653 RepID=A0A0R2K053_9LACO|nr:DUF5776 domain-containing protein [Pediococcus ethanolidurans]KRN82911.1 hypothetical protein IV87_GL001865 [Pediococcus ethanolidurans]GEN94674.1 hypothetical protein PET01_07240 [Pediococcus ethanolidurans]SER17104.1 Glycosyl hydrolases family 25 [Pediococcus ethanolidurans]
MANKQFNDVAVYQPSTTSYMSKLKSLGSSGVIVKASQGGIGGTPYFNSSAPSQVAHALNTFGHNRTGVYHYLLSSSVADSSNEMAWFIKCLNKLPIYKSELVVLDVEDPSLSGNVTARVNAAIDYLNNHSFPNVGVYYPGSWATSGKLKLSSLHTKRYWTAAYGVSQSGIANDKAWQYTDNWHNYSVDGSYEFASQGSFFPTGTKVTTKTVTHSYYNWNPRQVKALTSVGVYSNSSCTKQVRTYKAGTVFDVAKIVHISGKVYRLQLSNGNYLSGWTSHFLNMYYCDKSLKQVKTLTKVYLYKDVQRQHALRSYPKGTLFNVKAIVKMKSGLWEIKTTSGFYMTSNKANVRKTK